MSMNTEAITLILAIGSAISPLVLWAMLHKLSQTFETKAEASAKWTIANQQREEMRQDLHEMKGDIKELLKRDL